ncbi:MAG TPA: hypothetical protein VET85_13850 [Stellaceae bacterium]|nr:hypothetical protein [Stellaceae bacterium]
MANYPSGTGAAILAFLFVQKLAEHLEEAKILPPGMTTKLWADVFAELKDDGRVAGKAAVSALTNLKLAEE